MIRTQNALPGWRAWVDGKPQRLFLADGLLQAVPYPKGTDSLTLKYEPASFRLGLFVSLLALGGTLAVLGFRPLSDRRRRPRRA